MENNNERSVLGRFFGILFRVLVVVLLGIGIGAAVYVGVPEAYRRLVEPVQLNTVRLAGLETELEQARSDNREARERTAERLAALEAAITEQGEALASAEAHVDALLTSTADHAAVLEGLADRFSVVEQSLSTLADRLDLSLAELASPEEELRREIATGRAMLHLMRARLWLLENNIGSAEEEVAEARGLLMGLDPDQESEFVQTVIARIDLALTDMRDTPFVAADDLEIAWKLLRGPVEPVDLVENVESEATEE